MMHERTPYYPESKARHRGAQLFRVNPNVTNEGLFPAVPGSVRNYPYVLPFLQRNFPVRRIRVFTATQVLGITPAESQYILLTLRKADGTYLLKDVPACTFVDFAAPGASPARNGRPILFGPDFFPDPRMSWAKWMTGGVTDPLTMEFIY